MDAGAIKVCPKCRGAWAGNIMRCVSCGAPMPDPEPEVKNVDEFKIGKLNYHPHEKTIDWPQARADILETIKRLGIESKIYIKESLRNL